MGLLVGPTPWWQASIVSKCPEGTILACHQGVGPTKSPISFNTF